jgi:hypothetical protein
MSKSLVNFATLIFFICSGLMGVEYTVNLLKQFQQDSNANRSHMHLKLINELDVGKKLVMEKALAIRAEPQSVQDNAVAGEKVSESVQENAMTEDEGPKSDKTKRRKILIRRGVNPTRP